MTAFAPLDPVRLSPPEAPLVTAAEARAHLRVTSDLEDRQIAAWLATAEQHLDARTGIIGRCLVRQTWREQFRNWPSPLTRLQTVPPEAVAVSYWPDNGGAPITVEAGRYRVLVISGRARIEPVAGASWPADLADRPDAVRVDVTAGWAPGDPRLEPARAAALLILADLYRNREAQTDARDALVENPTVARLVAPLRVHF